MSHVSPGTELGRNDVIGHKITDILQSDRTIEDDMEWVTTYYCLDSGAILFLPDEDAGGFIAAEPDTNCTSQNYRQLKPVLGRLIANVVRVGPQCDYYHDRPYLILDNGYAVTDVMGYPVGPGYAGLHIYGPDDCELSKMIDFFD